MENIFSKYFQSLENPYGVPVTYTENPYESTALPEPSYSKYMIKEFELKELLSNMICTSIIPGECDHTENIDNIDINTLLTALARCIYIYFQIDDTFCKDLKKIIEDIYIKASERVQFHNNSIVTIKYNIFSESDQIFLKNCFINICIYLIKIYGTPKSDNSFSPIYKNTLYTDYDIEKDIEKLKKNEQKYLLKYISSKFQYKILTYRPFYDINKILRRFQFDEREESDNIHINTKICEYNPKYTIERLLLLLQLLRDETINIDEFMKAIQIPDYKPIPIPRRGGGRKKNKKKYTQKAGFKFPWTKKTLNRAEDNVKRDLGSSPKKSLLDKIFLKLCDKKQTQVKLDNTKRKGILYKACNYIYPEKFSIQKEKELKNIRPTTNENRRANELLAQYHRNLGKTPPQRQQQPRFITPSKKANSPVYSGL